jgi:hypothetical protein
MALNNSLAIAYLEFVWVGRKAVLAWRCREDGWVARQAKAPRTGNLEIIIAPSQTIIDKDSLATQGRMQLPIAQIRGHRIGLAKR